MNEAEAREIVICAHEAAHAVAAVRLGLPFEYVTLDDAEIGPHVQPVDNQPRPIAFYTGPESCCRSTGSICDRCRAEQVRAESNIVAAICGSIGAAVTGCRVFGYGEAADKAYVIEVCRTSFGDRTNEDADRRTKTLLQRGKSLMEPEMKTLSAVAKELRARRRLSQAEVELILTETAAEQPQ
jgi:hypothetical protein